MKEVDRARSLRYNGRRKYLENDMHNYDEPMGGKTMTITSSMALFDFVTAWLHIVKRQEVKAATYERLSISSRTLERYEISHVSVCDLTEYDFRAYINELISDNYKLTTIKKQMLIVSAPMHYAFTQRMIPFDPCASVKTPPKSLIERKQNEIVAYNPEEQDRARRELRTGKRTGYPLIELLLETGMRTGEALALNWSDITMSQRRNYINVHATMVDVCSQKRTFVQEGAKSKTSNRIIPLSARAFEILSDLKARSESEYVFANANGERLSYKAVLKHCKAMCESASIPYYGLHAWRHTFATNQYYKGTDIKILSKLLGHADTSITYNVYIHLYGDAYDEMANAMM